MRRAINIHYNFYYGEENPFQQVTSQSLELLRSDCRQVNPFNPFTVPSPNRRVSLHDDQSPRRQGNRYGRDWKFRSNNPFRAIDDHFQRELSHPLEESRQRQETPNRRISSYRQDSSPQRESPFRHRQDSPYRLREESPNRHRQESPYQHRQESPYRQREESPCRQYSPFRQESDFRQRQRNFNPFERDSKSPAPANQRCQNPFRRRHFNERQHSLIRDEREWSVSHREKSPSPCSDHQTTRVFRRRWLIRRRPSRRQLSAYSKKIEKLTVLRRRMRNRNVHSDRTLLRCLNGEIRTLKKLSRAVRGLPLNRIRYQRKIALRLEEKISRNDQASDDEACLNEPDVFQFLD